MYQRSGSSPAAGLAPGLPPQVDLVLARALAADPAGRYHSGREFIDALAGAARGHS